MRGVICIKDNNNMVKVQSYMATRNGSPQMKDVVNGTTVTNTTYMNSKLYCSYRRKLTVPPGSENYMLDLTTDRIPMWAAGPNDSPGVIAVHDLRSMNPQIMDIRFIFQVIKNIILLPKKFCIAIP